MAEFRRKAEDVTAFQFTDERSAMIILKHLVNEGFIIDRWILGPATPAVFADLSKGGENGLSIGLRISKDEVKINDSIGQGSWLVFGPDNQVWIWGHNEFIEAYERV